MIEFLGQRAALNDHGSGQNLRIKRKRRGGRERLHSGQALHAPLGVAHQLGDGGCLLEARFGERHLHGEDVMPVETGMDSPQRHERPQEQSRSRQQNKR
jgi:hypothetical protein